MTGVAFADPFILRRIRRAAGITGDGFLHAFDVLENLAPQKQPPANTAVSLCA
jgi:hypothetical protein